MSEVSEGLSDGNEAASLLDAYIAEGDFDDADYLSDGEAPEEAAQAAEDADQPDTEEDEVEAATEDDDGTDADADDDGDYVELDLDDGTTERVSLTQLLEDRKTLAELGSTADEIRHNIAEQAAAQIQERHTALDQQITQTVELYATLEQLLPNVEAPDPSMLDQYSPNYGPEKYRQQMQAYEWVTQTMEGAKGTMRELKEKYDAEQAESRKIQASRDWAKLTSLDKTWLEGDAAKRLNTLRQSTADAYGLAREMVGTITEPGFIRMAEDAQKYREAAAKGVTPKKKAAPRLVKGGQGRAKKDPTSARRAKANDHLRKTGKVADLESTWGEFL